MSRKFCAYCGEGATNDDGSLFSGAIFDGTHYFCRSTCQKKYLNKLSGGNSSTSSSKSSSSSSAGSSAGADIAAAGIGAGAGLAAAGAGAAVAGVGAAVKGIGSLIGGIGKGADAMGDLMKSGVEQSKMNTKIAQDLIDYKFSDDPETYKKEINDMYFLAMSKASFPPNPQEWSKITYAKKRLCTEFNSMAKTNPALYAEFAQSHEALKKRKTPWTKYIIGLAIALGCLFTWAMCSVSSDSSAREKTMANETARLEAIVSEIDTAMESKDYETALYKATKLQWMVDDPYREEVEKWDARRQETISTIEKLSGKKAE